MRLEGTYATAEEAALVRARELRQHRTPPPVTAPMTAEEAVASAAAEGLTLRRNEESATGFEGVTGKVGARTRIQPAQQSACLHTCGFHLTAAGGSL